MTPTDFAALLTEFLAEYLPGQRNVSSHTVKSYRDVFALLLRYCGQVRSIPPERLALSHLDAPLILDFLDHLEEERRSSTSTRNQRLTAIHSFCRFAQSRIPERILQFQRIMAIPSKRTVRRAAVYLSSQAMRDLLSRPDPATASGRRNMTLLSLMYDTGARVQELIDLRVEDVRLARPAHVRITGKGRKARLVPLLPATAALVEQYLKETGLREPAQESHPLFFNSRQDKLSRSGVRHIVNKYATRPDREGMSWPDTVTPHAFRHSKAMHLLQAGNPLPVIQAILGHADIRSTGIYAHADIEMKRAALERTPSQIPAAPAHSWLVNKGLLNWLKSL
jgi:site-specific recombinase XerD